MARGIFITATGTDVGKTFISGLLVKKIREFNINCGYYKPVLSGLAESDHLNDCEYVLKTANINNDASEYITYGYAPSISPHLAAVQANCPIEQDKILSDFKKISKEFDYIVVEGAGGILCPLRMDEKQLLLPDIIKALKLDIIIVADSGLGSINHTVLTYEYARQIGLNVKGIILNNYENNNFMHEDNKKCIENLTGAKILAVVPQNTKELDISKETVLEIFKEIDNEQ